MAWSWVLYDRRAWVFIIFSGDADFRPVLLRLRAYDRRTVILTVGPSSAAFERASDYVIRSDDFVEKALGFAAAPTSTATITSPSRPARSDGAALAGVTTGAAPTAAQITAGALPLRDRVGEEIRNLVARSAQAVPLARLAQLLNQAFGEDLRDSNWLGFGGVQAVR